MAKAFMRGSCSFNEAENFLRQEIPQCGISCELSDHAYHCIGDVRVSILVFEKYFMRASNYASLTLVLSGRDGDIGVDIIGAGGRDALLSFSWGTEESFVLSAKEVLKRIGFH